MAFRLPVRSRVLNCLVVAPPRSGWSLLSSGFRLRADVAWRDLRGLTLGDKQEAHARGEEAVDYLGYFPADLRRESINPVDYLFHSVFDRPARGEAVVIATVTPEYAFQLLDAGLSRAPLSRDFCVLWVHRNPAAAFVSGLVAAQTGIEAIPAGIRGRPGRPVYPDPPALTAAIWQYARVACAVRALPTTIGSVSFRRLTDGRPSAYQQIIRRLSAFLGLPPDPWATADTAAIHGSQPVASRIGQIELLIRDLPSSVRRYLQDPWLL